MQATIHKMVTAYGYRVAYLNGRACKIHGPKTEHATRLIQQLGAHHSTTHMSGVIPGRGPSPAPSSRRCTLMVAFWRDLQIRQPADGQLGASMPMPCVSLAAQPWLQDLAPIQALSASDGPCAAVPPAPVSVVWEPVLDKDTKQAPSYDACFQGF